MLGRHAEKEEAVLCPAQHGRLRPGAARARSRRRGTRLKEAELRWEEADAMVRALERKLRESGATAGDAQAEAVND